MNAASTWPYEGAVRGGQSWAPQPARMTIPGGDPWAWAGSAPSSCPTDTTAVLAARLIAVLSLSARLAVPSTFTKWRRAPARGRLVRYCTSSAWPTQRGELASAWLASRLPGSGPSPCSEESFAQRVQGPPDLRTL